MSNLVALKFCDTKQAFEYKANFENKASFI